MSVCEYCGEKVGWFQTSHSVCITKANYSRKVVEKLVFDGILGGQHYDELCAEVRKVLAESHVSLRYVRDAVHQGANDAASQIALKSPVSHSEFNRLVAIIRGFDESPNGHLSSEYAVQMVQRKWFASAQLHMSYVLWQVLNDITPHFEETGEVVAFNLRTEELPIFQTGDCVTYAEERTVSNRSRSYQGLSIPVGGGIYYHIGGSQGHQDRTSGLLPLDGGKVLITTKSLYFGGKQKTFRIPLDHVVRYQPYVDGVGVCEDRKAPKVFVFDYRGMDAGWFFYNLLLALSNPQVDSKTPEKSQGVRVVTDLQNAFATFRAASDIFTDLLGGGTITSDHLAKYTTTVEGLFVAARTLEEEFEFVSTNAREKYNEARENMETCWRRFASVDDGNLDGDACVPFLKAVGAFMKTRNECVLG